MVSMTPVQAIQAALQACDAKQLQRVSKLSGVPRSTIYEIRRVHTKDPRSSTGTRLRSALAEMGLLRDAEGAAK